MTAQNSQSDGEAQEIVRHEVWLAVIFLGLLLAAVGLSGILFRQEVSAFAAWVYARLGFAGLSVLLLLSETFVSPFPPDVFLLLVAASEPEQGWQLLVAVLAFLSTLGGHAAWLLGSQLGQIGVVRRMLGRHHTTSVAVTRRYGVWAVVLAALTPLPWSVTSWTAGALHMPWRTYLLGSLVRFPRIVVYYLFMRAAFHGV